MPAKRVFMSLLDKDEALAQKMMQSVKSYGLEVSGHFWSDNLEKMEWMGPRGELLDKATAMWIIVGVKPSLMRPETRFGLSLLSLTVQAARGHGFPIAVIYAGDPVTAADLPTPLKHADLLAHSAAMGAKLVAKASVPFKPTPIDYRIDVYGLAGLGLWLEVGSARDTWKGVMCGVSNGDIDAHGVGPKSKLPMDKMVLNYPQKGLKLKLGEKDYTAWAVQNELDPASSYFVRATGMPDSILFGQFAQDDNAEVYIVALR